jgi:hypothetical protein
LNAPLDTMQFGLKTYPQIPQPWGDCFQFNQDRMIQIVSTRNTFHAVR